MTDTRRYVLLRHECPADYRDGPHWDLMVEDGKALRTWSLLELPKAWEKLAEDLPVGSDVTTVKELPPHRLAYLEYEGKVSGGRGHVARVASGNCHVAAESSEQLTVLADSGGLAGEWRFEKSDDAWRLTIG